MNRKTNNLVTGFLVLSIAASGCATLHVGQQAQAGRRALQSGRSSDAVTHLMQAAELNPDYALPYRVRKGVLTYLGRAYYETKRDEDAARTLEKAIAKNQDDHLARLYLGLIRMRNGEPERGRVEGESGLKGLYDTLEYFGSDNFNGAYWDPGREIRSENERTLASRPQSAEFILAAENIGSRFDVELDRAQQDEARSRRGGGGGE